MSRRPPRPATGDARRAGMASLVGSLADNKAALGRRYAEWGVSAPTLESAVAAAAMAQDEMGHARSTYPVLKALGVEAGEDGLEGGGRRLALLDDELPDWTAFIAANLLVDGVLTTFVAACVDSTLAADGPARAQDPPGGGLAPRARRGVGASGCAGPATRSATRCSRACGETWEHAGALGRAGRRPRRSRRRSSAGLVRRDAGRSARAGARAGSSSCSAPRASRSRSTSPPTGRAGTRARGAGSRERRAALPVLRRRRRRARRPVGRADHHRAVALPRVQLPLRGAARRLRRRRALRAPRLRPPRASGSSPAPIAVPGRVALLEERRGPARRGHAGGSMAAGRSGSRNGNLRHSWTSSVCARERRPRASSGARRREVVDEAAVGVGDARRGPTPRRRSCAGRRSRRSPRGTTAGRRPIRRRTCRAASSSRSTWGLIHSPPPSDPKPAHASRVRAWWRTSRRSSGTRSTTSSQRPSHSHGSPKQ